MEYKTFTHTLKNGIGTSYNAPENIVQDILNGDKERAYDIIVFLLRMGIAYDDLVPIEKGIFYKVEDGHKFLVKINEPNQGMNEIIQDLILRKEYEPETTKLVKDHVKECDTVVDVGASIGHFALSLARQVGASGKVIAIEPTKNQFPYLLENIKLNGYTNIEALNIGAADVNETIDLQVNAGSRFPLECRVLDEILPEKVDFIKIDVDGSEPRVLKGLVKTFERNPQLKMIIEYYPKYQKRLGNEPKEMIEILDKYFNYDKIEGDYGGNEENPYWNYFCIRK